MDRHCYKIWKCTFKNHFLHSHFLIAANHLWVASASGSFFFFFKLLGQLVDDWPLEQRVNSRGGASMAPPIKSLQISKTLACLICFQSCLGDVPVSCEKDGERGQKQQEERGDRWEGGREKKEKGKRKRKVTSREFNPERILNWQQIVLFCQIRIWTESYKIQIAIGIVTVLLPSRQPLLQRYN